MVFIELKPLSAYLNPLKLSLINSTTSLLNKSLAKTATNVFHQAHQGFIDASNALRSTPFMAKSSQTDHISQAYTLQLSKSYSAKTSVYSYNNNGTINTGIIYNAQGRDTSKLNATLDQFTTKTVAAKGQPSYTQTTQLNQVKNAASATDYTINKTLNSTDIGINNKTATGYVKQDIISSTSAQNTAKTTNQNSNTATVADTLLKDASGNVIKENYSNRIVDVASTTGSQQNIVTNGDRNVIQAVNTAKATIGGTTFANTNIATTDVRNTGQTITNAIDTQTATSVTNLNKAGEVTGQQTVYTGADYDSTQVINTGENIATNRGILSTKTGQVTTTTDQTITQDTLNQTVSGLSSNTAQTLDAQGNVIKSATTYVKSEAATQQQANTATNQVIQQGPAGAIGFGTTAQEINTKTTTNITTATPAAVTDRTIERDVTNVTNRDWAGSINVTSQENGTKAYNLASIDVSQANMVDVTKEGQNQLKITTDVNSAKEVQGNIAYKPAEVQPVANIGASVGVSFGSYTGLASSFKLDTGEVNFNLNFASADVTQQATEKTGQATTQTEQGQLTDANLQGKLTSTVNEDGSRTINVTATYQKEGDKYAIANGGAKTEAAIGEGNSTLEVTGSITLNKEGNVKSMDSNFDIYKVSNASAEGTSEATVRQALDQSDPLRKSFSFENGTFKFQLGFANLNFAIYA